MQGSIKIDKGSSSFDQKSAEKTCDAKYNERDNRQISLSSQLLIREFCVLNFLARKRILFPRIKKQVEHTSNQQIQSCDQKGTYQHDMFADKVHLVKIAKGLR